MIYTAEIDVMPLKALLDPQGRAVTAGLKNLGFGRIENVRIGKHISLEVDAKNDEDAERQVSEACRKLLANDIMESYEFRISKTQTVPK